MNLFSEVIFCMLDAGLLVLHGRAGVLMFSFDVVMTLECVKCVKCVKWKRKFDQEVKLLCVV
jgi:hypothetical protein